MKYKKEFCIISSKKKFDNILLKQKLALHIQNILRHRCNLTSSLEKDPYPNKALTISSELKLNQDLLVLII